jgi:hypothetical protein
MALVPEQIGGNNKDDGVIIGGITDSKIAFYGATPVVQATTVPAATDTSTLVTSVTAIILALKNIGITL